MTNTVSQLSYHDLSQPYPRSHHSSPTPHILQCSILLRPPSLIPSFPPLGVPSAPPLVSSAPPLPHALAPSLVFLAPGCSGEPQGHRLQHHGQTRGAGASGTAVGAGEARAGEVAGTLTLRNCPRPPGPPSGPSGRNRRRSGGRQLLCGGVGHEGLPNGGSGRRDGRCPDSCDCDGGGEEDPQVCQKHWSYQSDL